jgi:DDE superfamily endonuclease
VTHNQDAAAAAATVTDEARPALLAGLLGQVADCLPRRETRQSCGQMLSGLLMELEDHNCWTIAEAVGYRGAHRLQHLRSRAVWDEQQVLDIAAGWAAGHLDDGDGVLIVDETADEKSSGDTAGAARQYSGTVDGIRQRQMGYVMAVRAQSHHHRRRGPHPDRRPGGAADPRCGNPARRSCTSFDSQRLTAHVRLMAHQRTTAGVTVLRLVSYTKIRVMQN